MKIVEELKISESRTTIYVEADDEQEAIAEAKLRGTVLESYPARGINDPEGPLWVVVIESESE